jgi:hypothetical protein
MTTHTGDEEYQYKYDCYVNMVPSRNQVAERYERFLYELLDCKDPQEFERILYSIFDFLDTWKFFKSVPESTCISMYKARRWFPFCGYACRFDCLCLFDIVFLKNKKLLPELKKRNLGYVNSRMTYPIIYDYLMNKDIDTVDYIVSNGYEIISEYGWCFYDYHKPEIKDMVEILIDMKNTTSLMYIYEHTSVNALKEYFERHKLFEYIYEHVLPY